ncbi:MAG: hypothetical protein NC218_12770 [Acetobacter sp.]|nr:hypothetical protein [Acetobacter sp.]
MDSKSTVKNIVSTILQKRYFSLRKEIIRGLQHSSISPKFYSESLTSSLAYSRLDCDALVDELKEKAIAGQNGDVAAKKYADRVNNAAKYLATIKKNYTIRDILDNMDRCPLFSEGDGTIDPAALKDYFVSTLSALEPASTDSTVAIIIASIVKAKVSSTLDTEAAREYEKIMEPLVIAMIEDKGKFNRNYANGDMGVGELKAQVIAMTNRLLTREGADPKGATKYFHDVSLIHLISAIPTKSEDIPTGITNETNSPMFYIDEEGTARRLIKDATYIPGKGICELLEMGDKNGNFSAMRRIQGLISPRTFDVATGKINTAFSNNEKLTQEYMTLLFLADGLGLELKESTLFAIVNPLNKELHTIEDEESIEETVDKALQCAKQILQDERGIHYEPEADLLPIDFGHVFVLPDAVPPSPEEEETRKEKVKKAKASSKVTVSTGLIKLAQKALSALRKEAYKASRQKEADSKKETSRQKSAEQKQKDARAVAESTTDAKEKANARRRATTAGKTAAAAGAAAEEAKQESKRFDSLGKVLDDFLTGITDNSDFIRAIITGKTDIPGLKGNTNTIDELKSLAAVLKEVLDELGINAASLDKKTWDALLSDKEVAKLVANKVQTIVEGMPQTRDALEMRAHNRLGEGEGTPIILPTDEDEDNPELTPDGEGEGA